MATLNKSKNLTLYMAFMCCSFPIYSSSVFILMFCKQLQTGAEYASTECLSQYHGAHLSRTKFSPLDSSILHIVILSILVSQFLPEILKLLRLSTLDKVCLQLLIFKFEEALCQSHTQEQQFPNLDQQFAVLA